MNDQPKRPIGDQLPAVGRARDLDVEFLELFADITAQLAILRVIVTSHPDFTKEAADKLKEQENAILARFDRIMTWLSKGNERG